MSVNFMKMASEIQDPIRFPDEALQRMVKSPNPTMPMEQSLAMGEWMRRQKLRQTSSPQGQTDNRTVKDMVVEAAQQKNAMENNPAIQNYPQPQMDTRGTVPQQTPSFKGGGLVAFAGGGMPSWAGPNMPTNQTFMPSGGSLPVSGAEAASGLNPGDVVFGSPVGEGLTSIGNTLGDLWEGYKKYYPPKVALELAKKAFTAQAKVGDIPQPAAPVKVPGIPNGAPTAQSGLQQFTGQLPGGSGVSVPSVAPAPATTTKAPNSGGIAAVRPDMAAYAKDIIGDKPETKTLDQYYEEQAKFWEKHLGKDGYTEEKDQLAKDRERADSMHENSRAYAMLSAAGAMTDVRVPGLAGFLQGLGRAASASVPALFKGDEDYDRMVKEANRTSLEIKKGERAEAAGKMAMAEKAYDAAQNRLEKFQERRAAVLGGIQQSLIQADASIKGHQISAGAVGRSGIMGLYEASGLPKTPDGFREFMEAYSGPKNDAASEIQLKKQWTNPANVLLRQQYGNNYDAFKRAMDGQTPVRSAASLGLD